jgi:hypothetical protein
MLAPSRAAAKRAIAPLQLGSSHGIRPVRRIFNAAVLVPPHPRQQLAYHIPPRSTMRLGAGQ